MPYHVVVRLPDGRAACADHREPVTRWMHRINQALGEQKPGALEDYEKVAAWLDVNAAQSARCHAGLAWHGPGCGHD